MFGKLTKKLAGEHGYPGSAPSAPKGRAPKAPKLKVPEGGIVRLSTGTVVANVRRETPTGKRFRGVYVLIARPKPGANGYGFMPLYYHRGGPARFHESAVAEVLSGPGRHPASKR